MPTPAADSFDHLVRIMRALRAPGGCPWDREQTLQSLRPYVLEETYELLDALDKGDLDAVREELGDFLYEAVFLAQIAEEAGHFSIADAVGGIAQKLVRRHPHVFTPDGTPLADAPGTMTADDVVKKWEDLKAAERGAAGQATKTLLSGVPRSMPALLRAYEMTARAATVGFDWTTPDDVVAKIGEELGEVRDARTEAARSGDTDALEDELGDLLFACANYARKLGVEPEAALRRAADKFQGRFTRMEERAVAAGTTLKELTLDQQNALWETVKRDETKAARLRPEAP
ncbi:MAG: nucleoside triphosphate pyrophosphohydrolase [Acidobacteria bacterium]|nr:nucleoside triphosphate pyrophosphohydrolase [Acidobacteriota bacterium]